MTCPGCRKELEPGATHCGEKRCQRVASGGWHWNSIAAKQARERQQELKRKMDRSNADARAFESGLHRSVFD